MATTTQPGTSTSNTTRWTAPAFIHSFYSKFPLVILEQDDQVEWKVQARNSPNNSCVLWIHPPSANSSRSWTSSSPTSLRTQLLFLLRDSASSIPVLFKNWSNEDSAPNGKLPALHLPSQDRLLSTEEIRSWLEGTYPLKGKDKELQGLSSQEKYDQALSLSHLILGHLLPSYYASLPSSSRPSEFHLLFPKPPPLLSGYITPLPASLTGDARDVNLPMVIDKGVEVLKALNVVIGENDDKWAFGSKRPTAIDALITSHIYVLYSLPTENLLHSTLSTMEGVKRYVDRVLDYAESRIRV